MLAQMQLKVTAFATNFAALSRTRIAESARCQRHRIRSSLSFRSGSIVPVAKDSKNSYQHDRFISFTFEYFSGIINSEFFALFYILMYRRQFMTRLFCLINLLAIF